MRNAYSTSAFKHGGLSHVIDIINNERHDTLTKQLHNLDQAIIKLLQQQGLIKKEAEARLKQEVYKLDASEVAKIKNYTTHFGLRSQDVMINEILELRREAMYNRLICEAEAPRMLPSSRVSPRYFEASMAH